MMTKPVTYFKSKKHFFGAAFISGILIGTSYIPYPAWAIFFCYIPLWFAAIEAEKQQFSLKIIFALGWVTQFVLTLIGFHWIYYTATEFGHLHPILAGCALFLYAALMHIYIPLALTVSVWLKRRKNLSLTKFIFLISISLILLERVWPSIFEWNMGYTLLWMNWPWFQWADTIGFWGLSSILLLIQSVLLYLITIFKAEREKAYFGISALIITLTILHFSGLIKEKTWSRTDDVFRALVVQGNIANEEKIAAEKGQAFQPFVLGAYAELTNHELAQQITQQTQKPDALIWPETALPFALDSTFSNRPNQITLQNHINTWQTNLLTGGYSQDLTSRDHLGNYKVRNSIFFLSPTENSSLQPTPYFKTDLLVFGEYMPLGETFPILYSWLPFVGTYEKGPGPALKKIITIDKKEFNLGPQICYESLNSSFARGLATAGADIIINATNDSWYDEGTEPYQHMIMTLARGVEVRRPLVRATNTGISSVILANGHRLAQSPMNKAWAHTFDVKYQKQPQHSHYTKFGHFDYLLWIIALLFILFTKGHHVRDQKS